MIPPPAPKDPEEHDKTTSPDGALEPHALSAIGKSGAKAAQPSLNATFGGAIRAPSPNPSVLSIDDFNNVRLGCDPDYSQANDDVRHGLRSSGSPQTWRARIRSVWLANKGLALVLLSQVFGTLMNVTTRLLEMEGNNGNGYHPFQILFARMSITVICASLYMWRKKTEHFPFGMREVRLLLVARGLTGFFGVFGMYYSLLYLPLADATVITFLAPSLACWACSFLINEPFTRMEQIAAYVSLFGVVLIARPVSFFSSRGGEPVPPASGDSDFVPTLTNATIPSSHRLATEYDAVTPTQRAIAVSVAMLGVLGAAGAYTTLRWIGKRAHPLISVNYFATWCTIVSIVMMLSVPSIGFLLPANLKDWCYLLFLGICGFVMQFLLAAGLQYEKSSRATNMVYMQMLFALGFDKLVWGTTPGALSIIGSSLILGSAIYVAMHKENVKKEGDDGERGRALNRDEERGLMSPDIEAEVGEADIDIQMRTLRV